MNISKVILMLLSVSLFTVSCGESDEKEVYKSSERQILQFSVNGNSAIIDQTAKTIILVLPSGTNLTKLTPSIKISEKAAVNPTSEAGQDFTNPVKYTVRAEDGTKEEYTATLTVAKSSDKDILAFVILLEPRNVKGEINRETNVISAEVPVGTDISKIKPAITLSPGATISPDTEIEQDFTNPVVYTVTAQDGSQQEYIVDVKDEVANADPHQVITIMDGSDKERPYRHFAYNSISRALVRYTIAAPERPFEDKNMDVVEIVYENDSEVGSKVNKIIKIEDAEIATERKRTFNVTYPDTKTIHVTEDISGSISDVITLNDELRVSEYVKGGESEKYEYDAHGNLIKVINANGYKVIEYDNKNGIFNSKNKNTPQWVWLYTIGRLVGTGSNNFVSEKIYASNGRLLETIEYRYVFDSFSWYPNAYKKVGDKRWMCMFYQ